MYTVNQGASPRSILPTRTREWAAANVSWLTPAICRAARTSAPIMRLIARPPPRSLVDGTFAHRHGAKCDEGCLPPTYLAIDPWWVSQRVLAPAAQEDGLRRNMTRTTG